MSGKDRDDINPHSWASLMGLTSRRAAPARPGRYDFLFIHIHGDNEISGCGGYHRPVVSDIDIVGRRVQNIGQLAQENAPCIRHNIHDPSKLIDIVLAFGQRARALASLISTEQPCSASAPFRSVTS